ncbi:MAG: peptidylprolyl isomerase [Bacteroidota bacterium]
MIKKILVSILGGIILCIPATLSSQTLDRIVAVIGEEIVLESDVDNQYNYLTGNGQKDDGTLRCVVLEQLIVSKLLLNKAEQDSIIVSEDEVLGEIDRRIEYMMSQLNNDESEFEKRYGSPLIQFREDLKPDIEDELLINRQRSQIFSEASITPREVEKFYKTIPKDSLGLFPAEVEYYQLVLNAPYSEESVTETVEKLDDLRDRVLNENADFGLLAQENSQGPSARNQGLLGQFGRGQMVPEFEAVVYNMRKGEISKPFLTEFGYHIVRLEDRTGELLTARHILIKPRNSANGDSVAIKNLNDIRTEILNDSLTFEQAAIRHSEDRGTKDCGGCVVNPQTLERKIPMDALDAETFFLIDELAEGEISEPVEFLSPDGRRMFRILYLKTKIPPHKPDLANDYQKIHDTALRSKQADSFDDWLVDAKKNIYIELKPTECINALKNWTEN